MKGFIAVVTLTLLCAALWAQGEPVQVSTPTSAQMDQGQRVPVQKILRIRPLVPAEDAAVAAYLQQHKVGLTSQNYAALENALRLLIGVDQTHVPLTRTPAQYMADCQTFTQLLGRTDWYVNLPPQQPAAPQVIERTVEREVPVQVVVPQIVTLPMPVVLPARQFIQPAGVTATWTPSAPVNVGQVVVGTWQDIIALTVIYHQPVVCRTSPSGTCPPGEAPPPPSPPAAGGTAPPPPGNGDGNPGANQPPDAPDHPGHEQPWAPGPDHPNVADPVIENP